MRDFLRRHKRKFITASVVTAGLYYAYSYATSRLRDISDRATDERTAKDNLKRRFKQNQQDATFNVIAFMPELSEKILEALKVESITAELQAQKQGRSTTTGGSLAEDDTASMRSGYSEITHSTLGRRSKLELWNDVKITSITRIFSLYYCIALLVLFTRIQLNLIGRGNYVASVMSIVDEEGEAKITLSDESVDGSGANNNNNNNALTREYMTFTWFLLNRGWSGVVDRVKGAVEEVFSRLEVREDITLSQIRLLTSRVRSVIEFNGSGDDHYDWLPHVLPPRDQEAGVLQEGGSGTGSVSPDLRALLDESAREMGSQESALLISRCLDLGLAQLLEVKLKAAFNGRDKMRVANVLPVMTREAHVVGNQQPNEYLQSINAISELDGFSARLFTSFEVGPPMDGAGCM
ncbi:putative Peroxisomal membrane protein [Taphrina deformans PYCC 5710]|uniref:Peroxisomal membrane protein n=1 Tax=Taphrina deformans (strain PYCC 5710 / ATCC 11124 / CBS 356.35 / IMI 108563 / JCM 9778 / NBRC 8474) TaxID=1097556 RepID=R4XCW5_TAPDE|nr:putative Peroxisomal membrane protein [Taphrina deformans PYCC 5710]|eukprot:CCG81165.1 putative Peroxisomal membrane protein [Taphrina deformans PYCC 5710]